jgi:hypothetical protein
MQRHVIVFADITPYRMPSPTREILDQDAEQNTTSSPHQVQFAAGMDFGHIGPQSWNNMSLSLVSPRFF